MSTFKRDQKIIAKSLNGSLKDLQKPQLKLRNITEKALIELFDYLNFDDICSLTLTCKQFNSIIGSSSLLMDKFRLKINNETKLITRKYQNFLIGTVNKTLLCHMENIRDLKIGRAKSNLNRNEIKDLIETLNFPPILRRHKSCKYSTNFLYAPLPSTQLDSLHIERIDKINLELLSHCTVRRLKLDGFNCRNDEIKISAIKNFLKHQKQLQVLEIVKFDEIFDIFNDKSLIDVDFKLKTLELNFCKFRGNLKFFKKFLNNQKSLADVILSSNDPATIFDNCVEKRDVAVEIVNVLRKIRHIKQLTIKRIQLNFKTMPHIEKLAIEAYEWNTTFGYHKKFPNVTNLTLKDIQFRCIKIVEKIPKNARNEIFISYFKIPDVKILTLDNVCFADQIPFSYANIHVDELTIKSSCTDVEWLIEHLENDDGKFKSLTLDMNMTKTNVKQLEIIENFHRSVENVKINQLKINCMVDAKKKKCVKFA